MPNPSDDEIIGTMKLVLEKPENQGICNQGRGGLETSEFKTQVKASFNPNQQTYVGGKMLDFWGNDPFKPTTNTDGDLAICLIPGSAASLQRGAGSDASPSVAETAVAASTSEISEEKITKRPWPPTEPERFAEVRAVLVAHMESSPTTTAADIQAEFARVGEKRIKEILDTLVALGIAQEIGGKYSHMT